MRLLRILLGLPVTLLGHVVGRPVDRLIGAITPEECFTVRGSHGSCRVPLSLAEIIVENIDVTGIHRSTDLIRLDGGKLDDVAVRGIPGLTHAQRTGLARAGDVGLESAALSFSGDVVLIGVPATLVQRAQQRAATAGFVHADFVLALAADAARVSGRRLSGALVEG